MSERDVPARPFAALFSRPGMFRRLIPSMFHRRLLLIGVVALAGAVLLALQTYRLTIVQGGGFLELAERRLVEERWTPTVRGRIIDRKGRILASDAPGFDVHIDYSVLSGQWAYNTASREVARSFGDEWDALAPERRVRAIEAAASEKLKLTAQLWSELAAALEIDLPTIERRRSEILAYVQRTSVSVNMRRLKSMRKELERERGRVGVDLSLADVSIPIREEHSPHPIARGIDEQTARAVGNLSDRFPGLHVLPSGVREYAYQRVRVQIPTASLPRPLREQSPQTIEVEMEGPLTHIVGWMRKVFAEDTQRRPRIDPDTGKVDPGHYQPGDRIGRTGIEQSQEYRLRGQRGRVIRHLDTGTDDTELPLAGNDVQITIDAALQARIAAIMDPAVGLAKVQPWHTRPGQVHSLALGTPLYGAATVIEIESGEILAMVSTPSFDLERLREDADSVWQDPVTQRGVNKAVSKPYPPGSIVKPLILVAAVSEGTHDLATAIECTGHLLPFNKTVLRCWIYKQSGNTHHDVFSSPLVARQAIAVSCNIFFYTLARQLGVERLVAWYEHFGIGEAFDLGIGSEYRGVAGVDFAGNRAGIGEATLMGIGQGPVAWTPLHAADAYATLVRGGLRIKPRIVDDQSPVVRDLGISSSAVAEVLGGLRDAVTNPEYGSAYEFRYPDGTRERMFDIQGIAFFGKTGTAQAPDITEETETGEKVVIRSGDHSWFVILAGPEGKRPLYAVSVVMEYAGSGGRVSGPIANQIVRALVAEGYL